MGAVGDKKRAAGGKAVKAKLVVVMKKTKKKEIMCAGPKRKLGSALKAAMIKGAGRTGGHASTKDEKSTILSTPIHERAGYPVTLAPTAVKPENWKSKDGRQVMVDFNRSAWLPDDWGQGVKSTKRVWKSTDHSGGMLTSFCGPDGAIYYHKHMVERHVGRKLTAADGVNGRLRSAWLQGTQAQAPCGKDDAFFQLLTPQEKKCIPRADEIHFCVVSARRAGTPEGLKDIATMQAQLGQAGVVPTWYVDESSVLEYRKFGLKAVVGGKLTPSRNKAIDDAQHQGKICCQMSDDIGLWEYHHGKPAAERTDDAQNAAFAAATRYVVSPVAAARFLVAKMRAAADRQGGPQLAGVFPLSGCARSFAGPEVGRHHFILGDFFVVGAKSKLRFDEAMTLKEDYGFTAAHISEYGSVLRCNRMCVHAKHYSNFGGACTNRDAKGEAERRNIEILMRKWPRAFRHHPTRKNEVVLQWRRNGKTQHDGDAAASQRSSSPRPIASDLPPDAVIESTGKKAVSDIIAKRCKKVSGLRVSDALRVQVQNHAGVVRAYRSTDLRYDLSRKFLALKRGSAPPKIKKSAKAIKSAAVPGRQPRQRR